MKTKLRLDMGKDAIEKPKSTQDRPDVHQISQKLKKLVGSVKLPEGFDDKKELSTYLENKHF